LLCSKSIFEEVYVTFWCEELLNGFNESIFYRSLDGSETLSLFIYELRSDTLANIVCNLSCYVFLHKGDLKVLQHLIDVVLAQNFVTSDRLEG